MDGKVGSISDFGRLNDFIKLIIHPLPYIKNIIHKLYKCTYSMTLYLMMGYYNIIPMDNANKICMITTPFGNYK